jgi:hypothetical protein
MPSINITNTQSNQPKKEKVYFGSQLEGFSPWSVGLVAFVAGSISWQGVRTGTKPLTLRPACKRKSKRPESQNLLQGHALNNFKLHTGPPPLNGLTTSQ